MTHAGIAFAWMPGFGSITTTLAGRVEDVAIGAVGLGLVGAVTGWSVDEKQTHAYQEMLQADRKRVVVRGAEPPVRRAYATLRRTEADRLDIHGVRGE